MTFEEFRDADEEYRRLAKDLREAHQEWLTGDAWRVLKQAEEARAQRQEQLRREYEAQGHAAGHMRRQGK